MKMLPLGGKCPDGYAQVNQKASDGPPGMQLHTFCFLKCSVPADCCGDGVGEAYCNGGSCAVR